MAVSLSPIGGAASQFFTSSGVPLSGGKMYTYEAGTTTPKAAFTEANGLTAHSNPIILDSTGRVPGGEIWLTSEQAYLFVLKASNDTLIGTWDNIYGYAAGTADAVTEVQVATADQTDFVLTSMIYTPGTNTLQVYIDGVNQVVGNAYTEVSATTVTFVSGIHAGAVVKFVQINSAATDATLVEYTPAGPGAVPTTVQAKLRESVSVLDFGVNTTPGTTDCSAMFLAAMIAAATTNRKLVVNGGPYLLTSNIAIDISGKTLELDIEAGCVIHSISTMVGGTTFFTQTGAISITGDATSELLIHGGTFQGTGGSTQDFQNLVNVIGVGNVVCDSTIFTKTTCDGLRVISAATLYLANCNATYNLYAGVEFSNCLHTTIIGGNYSYNGGTTTAAGYGITAATRYNSTIGNSNVSITNVTANYNSRKGIDIHDGAGVYIACNQVKGFGYGGIYAVNEDGNLHYEKEVSDVVIEYNNVQNDGAWFTAMGFTATVSSPIQVGSFGVMVNNLSNPGTFTIKGNTLRKCGVTNARAGIECFTNSTGPVIEHIDISENTIMDSVFSSAGIWVNGPQATLSISVFDNYINGTSTTADILVGNGVSVDISNNATVSSSPTPISCSTVGYTGKGNKWNDNQIAQVYRNISFTDSTAKSGLSELYVENAGSASSVDVATVTVGGTAQNSMFLYVRVTGGAFDAAGAEVFHGWAIAAKPSGVATFTGSTCSSLLVCVSTLAAPVLSWVGSGDTRTLAVSLPNTYTSYHITVDANGWRCPVVLL